MIGNRKRLRLMNYDYSQPGIYFITICVKNRIHYFGDVINDEMNLNVNGKIAYDNWLEIPEHFGNIILDEFKVMPNHFHGIVGIDVDAVNASKQESVEVKQDSIEDAYKQDSVEDAYMRPLQNTDRTKMLLSKVIQQYKASVTRDINKTPENNFQWLRSFHDRIIRNERELNNIRRYIYYNALNWKEDIENKNNNKPDDEYYDRLFR